MALQAQARSDHDLSAAAPTTAASRCTRTRLSRDARRQARRAGRQDRQAGLARTIADPELGYSETMAPTVVKGKVLIGTNGGEYGIRGFVKAFDADTGKLLWTFNTIPENSRRRVGREGRHRARHAPRHPGREGQLAEDRRSLQELGGGVWQNPSVDLATNRIYFVVGNPSPDLDGANVPATISIPTRWSRSISTPANTSATSSTSPTTSGISTRSVRPVLVNVKDKAGKIIPGVHPRRQDRAHLRHDRKDCSLIRFSDAMVPQENMWMLPTKDRRPHAARRQRRCRMVADRDRSGSWAGLCASTCISR